MKNARCDDVRTTIPSRTLIAAAIQQKIDSKDQARRVTMLGLYSNVFFAATKLLLGIETGSAALTADALHHLTDVLGDIVALATIALSGQKQSVFFPYGTGRIESLGTLVLSGMLISGGGTMGYTTLSALHSKWESMTSNNAHDLLETAASNAATAVGASNSGGLIRYVSESPTLVRYMSAGNFENLEGASWFLSNIDTTSIALGVTLFSIVVKEWLFRKTYKIGEEARSSVLIANAWHHRQDGLSSVAAMVGIYGSSYYGMPLLDPIAGLIVTGMILKVGFETLYSSVAELTDRVTEDNDRLTKSIHDLARELCRSNTHLLNVHDVRLRRFGPEFLVDLHVVVKPTLSVTAAFHVGEQVKRAILGRLDEVGDVFVHIDAGADAFRRSDSFAQHYHGVAQRDEDNSVIARRNADIEDDVFRIVEGMNNKYVWGVSHCTVHYLDPRSARNGFVPVRLDVTLRLDTTLSLDEARGIAKLVQAKLLEQISDVHGVSIHVELLNHEK